MPKPEKKNVEPEETRESFWPYVIVLVLALVLGVQANVAWRSFVSGHTQEKAIAIKRTGDVAGELVILGDGIRWSPNDYRMHYRAGILFLENNEYQFAKQELEACVELAPNHAPALIALSEMYSFTGDNDAAREHINRALEITPSSWRVQRTAGTAAGLAGDHEAAIKYLSRADELSLHSEPVIFNHLAVAHLALGDAKGALKWARRTLEFDDEDAHAHLLAGKAFILMGHYKRAQEPLNEAARISSNPPADPLKNADALIHYARTQHELGQTIPAAQSILMGTRATLDIEQHRTLVEDLMDDILLGGYPDVTDPSRRAKVRNLLALVHVEMRNPERADELFRESEDMLYGIDASMSMVAHATVLQDLKRDEEALELLQRATKKSPELYIGRRQLAEVLTKLGRYEDARLQYALIIQDFDLEIETKEELQQIMKELQVSARQDL